MTAQPYYYRIFARETWMEYAACRNHPKDWWFPTEGQYESRNAKTARAICEECPVKQACGDYAIVNNEIYGIWGGKSASERDRTRRIINPPKPRKKRADRSPAATAIIAALADGRWHEYDTLVPVIEPHIDNNRAATRYNKIARRNNTPEIRAENLTTEMAYIGRRRILIDICHNLYQDRIIERSYGTVRLTSEALNQHHRQQKNLNGSE
jgi:WhiB family redox-sensing transcriptional regulator